MFLVAAFAAVAAVRGQVTQCGSNSLPSFGGASLFISSSQCPTTTNQYGTTTQTLISSCLDDNSLKQCIWDKYNSIEDASDQIQSLIGGQVSEQRRCEGYALLMDCITSVTTCSAAVSACYRESCTSGSFCYNSRLSASDPEQNKGCVSTSTYVASLPAMTWRSLRDNVDVQRCICDGRGFVDTSKYNAWIPTPAAGGNCAAITPTRLDSIPYCKLNEISGGSWVEADVAETWVDNSCDLGEALVTCGNEFGVIADTDVQEACYSRRDRANVEGIALGKKCYASCDPNSGTSMVVTLLGLALVF